MASVIGKRTAVSCLRSVGHHTVCSKTAVTQQRKQIMRIIPRQMTKSFTSTTHRTFPGLMPHSEDPEPPKTVDVHENRVATPIEDDDYHLHADEFMNKINERAEEVAEERDDVEVDYSSGVLTITMPPNGTYVINKQPPNKQIWLSSPLSGPKRYDWSIAGESIDQKEGSGVGEWIYLRDGTSLADLLRKELLIDVTVGNLEEQLAQSSTDPVE